MFFLPFALNAVKTKNALWRIVLIIVLLVDFTFLVLTKGRAGWIGLLVASVFIIFRYSKYKRINFFLLTSLFSIISIVAFLIFFKRDSSEGRILIYKVSADLLKRNWLTGIGTGQFKLEYNKQQAAYFSKHDINSKEALLADNSYYAFNDFYQILIGNGIVGLILILTALYFLVIHIKNVRVNNQNEHLFYGTSASLICILVASLFSYPLQIFPIQIHTIFCLAVITSYPSNRKPIFQLSTNNWFFRILLGLLCLIVTIHFFNRWRYDMKARQALKLSKSGFKKKAIEKYEQLYKLRYKDGTVLYLCAEELYHANRLTEAKGVIQATKEYYTSNNVYTLSARIANELGDYKTAEQDFKTALYMVPNRMLSRYNLMNFYLERKDTTNAAYWVKSILNMPIKVPSDITRVTKERVRKINKELHR